ncbi:hypothetical protein R3P38DRAFT_2601197 [Favolaschia claudopus]|uniref:Uncharacterized protein n=1 Tax=Favolaschia claudopus TaxID=2862362 RepID=A0AAW0DPT1_9AGAR
MERRYSPSDLDNLKQAELFELVKRQVNRWPQSSGKFKGSRTKKEVLRTALLEGLFTTNSPPPPTPTAHSATHSGSNSSNASISAVQGQPFPSLLLRELKPRTRNLGPARLGVDDPQNEGYQIIFAALPAADEPETSIVIGEASVVISNSNVLTVFVSSKPTNPLIAINKVFSASPRSKATQDKIATPLTPDELKYLIDLAKKTPGYDAFDGKINHRLANLDRVEYWRFIDRFCTKYFKTQWPAGINRSGTSTTISKAAIETALGLKQTSINEAIHMAELLRYYYDEGPTRSAEVVQLVETEAGTADKVGADVLKKFLIAWSKDHPVRAA